MKEFDFVLNCEEATQMKALALLIQKASSFTSSVHIQSGNKRANAKSLLGLMSLGLNNGDEIKIIAEGKDEEEAAQAVGSWLQNPVFDEE